MKKVLSALAVGFMVLVGSLIASAPAQAAPGCPTNAICFHDTSTSYPMEWRDVADSSTGECHNMTSFANNKTSYITNRTSRVWYVYTSSSCLDWAGTIYANSSGAMSGGWNNSISSYKRG